MPTFIAGVQPGRPAPHKPTLRLAEAIVAAVAVVVVAAGGLNGVGAEEDECVGAGSGVGFGVGIGVVIGVGAGVGKSVGSAGGDGGATTVGSKSVRLQTIIAF